MCSKRSRRKYMTLHCVSTADFWLLFSTLSQILFFPSFISFPQERFQVKNPPHTYLQKLRSYLDPAVTRKVSAPPRRLPDLLSRQPSALPSDPLSLVQDFLSAGGKNRFQDWRHGKVSYETAKVDSCLPQMAGWSGTFHWRGRALCRPSCGEDKWK